MNIFLENSVGEGQEFSLIISYEYFIKREGGANKSLFYLNDHK